MKPYINEPLKVGNKIRFLRTVCTNFARKGEVHTVSQVTEKYTALENDFYLYGEGADQQLREGTTWERVTSENEAGLAEPTAEQYEQAEIELALAHAPEIEPCEHCRWPVAQGFVCQHCGEG